MLTALKNLFVSRDADAVINDAVMGTPNLNHHVIAARHADLMDKAKSKGLDPTTLLFLIQMFGPLMVKLIERWLAKRA